MPSILQPSIIPQPFLSHIFQPNVEPVIEAGFLYTKDEVAMHGVSAHRAIDFAVSRGTEILVPADGWAVATYGEVQLTHEGEPRLISLAQALQHSERGDIQPPDEPGEAWVGYYGSYVVQIWHGQGRYTQYAHVDWADPRIPFYPPVVDEKGNLLHHPILRAPVGEYRKQGVAAKVRRGQVLGAVGMTGCGWGQRCYKTAEFDINGRPDFRHSNYTYWDKPHLHFMVFGRRYGKNRHVKEFWDPFGVYGEVGSKYPQRCSKWSAMPNSLWL